MKRAIGWRAGISYAAVFLIVTNLSRQAQGGWTGAMNGTGYGWASVNIVTGKGTSTASTPVLTGPSASIPTETGFAYNAPLPRDASFSDVAEIRGSPGYVWQATTSGFQGDGTDNTNIESRVTIIPYDCPTLGMDSTGILSPDGLSGSITVNAFGTPGTGLLLRGYEDTNGTPADINDLINHSSLKFDVLLVGPFDLNTSNCTALVIPFTTQTGNQNLYFVADGVAKSNPFLITCSASPVVIGACAPVTYPAPQITGGCGKVQYTFDPPVAELPLGVVATVTVTAFDEANDTNTCTFQVDTTAKAFTVNYPANVNLSCTGPITYPAPQIIGGCGPFTTNFSVSASNLAPGTPTPVQLVVTDQSSMLSVTNQFTAVRELTFQGFFDPINGTGGSSAAPLITVKSGSKLPIKFEVFCQGVPITTGTPPTILIFDSKGNQIVNGTFQETSSIWHFNWDTSGLHSKTTYELVVTLEDASIETVWIGIN